MLLALTAAGTATAQSRDGAPMFPEAPGTGPTLLHVGTDGLGDPRTTLSVVAAAWGPGADVDRRPPGGAPGAGGVNRWHYPTLGLAFEVYPEHANDRDPEVGWLTVRAPFNGRTPNGLYLGMPAADAMAIIERDYQVHSRTGLSWGSYNAERGDWVSVGVRGGSKKKSVASFKIRRDRLYEMSFRLAPEPWLRSKTLREFRNLAVLFLLAVGLTWIYRRWQRPLDAGWRRVRGPLGGVLVLGGVGFAVMGVQLLGSGGWGALAGLVFGGDGVMAVIVGVVLLAQALRGRS